MLLFAVNFDISSFQKIFTQTKALATNHIVVFEYQETKPLKSCHV